jgi:hypothetical protein
MRRSSFSRLVVAALYLVAGATLLSSPAEAQRKKASSAGASSPAPRRKRPPPPAAPAPVAEAAVDAAPAPPAAEEPPPVAAAPAPPPPAVSKRRKEAAAPPVVAEETTTDLGPPPQRSLRKKARGAQSNEVDEDGEVQPTRKKSPRLRRDVAEEEEEDRAANKSEEAATEKTDDAAPEKEAEAEPEPEPESDADVDAESPAAKRRRAKPFLADITASLRGFQRHFAYIDDRYNELPNYDLGGAPAIALEVGVYPFKNSKGTLSAGFTGSFDYAVGLGTTYKVATGEQEGTKSTTALGYALGVRGNYAFGSTLANVVGAGIEFGAQSFIVDHPPPVVGNANIPSVEYKFIRPNAVGRFPVMDRLSILGSAGYLMVSSAGEIISAEYFRGATSSASGLDLGVGAAYEIRMSGKGTLKFLELRPMLTFRRYTFKFNPNENEDPFVAAGATDDYIGLNLGVATRL